MSTEFFLKLDVLIGGVDINVANLLNVAKFRTFASIKSIENVEEIFEAIENHVRVLKYRSSDRQLLKPLLRGSKNVTKFRLSTPLKAEIRTIYNEVRAMDPQSFKEISTVNCSTSIRSEVKDPKEMIYKRLLHVTGRRVKEAAQVDVDFRLQKESTRKNEDEKWSMVCPFVECEMRLRISYDQATKHVRAESYERHIRSLHQGGNNVLRISVHDDVKEEEEFKLNCEIRKYTNKCRFCLMTARDGEYFEITELTKAVFHEFTSCSLMSAAALSDKICMDCNSILTNYVNDKRKFAENQKFLAEQLLSSESVLIKTEVIEFDDSQDICESFEDFSPEEFSEPELNAKLEESSDSDSFDNFFPPKEKKAKKAVTMSKPVTKKSSPKEKHGLKRVDGYFMCEQCSYKSKNTTSLQSHVWKLHNGPKPIFEFICELCSKDFRDRQGLRRHLNWHNNVIKFYCAHCEYKSHARDDLINHLLTHERFRPTIQHICDYEGCKASFRHPRSLRNHKMIFHLKQRNFECHLCNKRYARKCTLKSHIEFVHQKIRQFHCDVGGGCEASFAYKSHLNRHKRNIHKLKS